jgi:AAA+ ATPase superfamily predicted ATPase
MRLPVFADREPELAFPESAWRSDRAEFVVVNGRRRVGWTA